MGSGAFLVQFVDLRGRAGDLAHSQVAVRSASIRIRRISTFTAVNAAVIGARERGRKRRRADRTSGERDGLA